jgi:hypothetical protein
MEPAFARRLALSNPILLRELRGKLRYPRPNKTGIVISSMLGLALAGAYLDALRYAWADPDSHMLLYSLLGGSVAFGVALASPLMGAGTFAREMEAGTWQSLGLSLLTRRDLISGKLNAILVTCWGFAALVFPIILGCVRGLLPTEPGYDFIMYQSPSLLDSGADLLLVFTITWFLALWGMNASWHCHRATTAIVATVVSLIIASILSFMVIKVGRGISDPADPWDTYSPPPPSNYAHIQTDLQWALSFAIGSLLLLTALHYVMKRNIKWLAGGRE